MNRTIIVAIVVCLINLAAGNGAGEPTSSTSTSSTSMLGGQETYVLGPEDQLSIHVQDLEEIADKPVRLDPNGFIDLPLIGRVQAAGMSLDQLRTTLAARFVKYVDSPKITLNVTEYRSQPVSILGDVNNPGVHQLQGPQRLLDMISSAGGLKSDAGPKLTITRQIKWGSLPLPGAHADPSGKFTIADLDLDRLVQGHNPEQNIDVRPHDVLDISRADVVYVLGKVKKAGGFSLGTHQSISLVRALSLAEGLDRDALPNRAKILRASEDGKVAPDGTAIKLNEILAGKAPDQLLHANDVLFIPTNVAGAAMKRAAEAAIQVGTGIVIYH